MVIKFPRICDSCAFYRGDNTCKAYPEGIPLKGDDTHFEVRDDQTGTVVYEYDDRESFWLMAWQDFYPEVEIPSYLPKSNPPEVDRDMPEPEEQESEPDSEEVDSENEPDEG